MMGKQVRSYWDIEQYYLALDRVIWLRPFQVRLSMRRAGRLSSLKFSLKHPV